MAWTDYETPKITINLGNGKEGDVRGLDLTDMATLLSNHLLPMTRAAELFAAHKNDVFSGSNFSEFLTLMCREFPELAMEVISIGADEPKVRDMKLGAGIQISALAAIAKLTIEDAGGLGNLLAAAGNVLKVAASKPGEAESALRGALFNFSTSASGKKPTS